MHRFLPACLAALCLCGLPASTEALAQAGAAETAAPQAEQVVAGDLVLSGGWVRATLPGQKAGAGYLQIANKGGQADRLVSASSPLAPRLEIHAMQVENDVMTMRPVEGGLEIPAGGSVALAPGGLHLMFLGLSAPFAEGSTVEVDLHFERAGAVRLRVPVRRAGGHAM